MIRFPVALLCASALALALGGLADGQAPAKLGADAEAVVQGNNVFALDLYGRLRQQDGNLFFSPYSISDALAMTYAGARGQTAEQMATTLHFGLPAARLHPAFGELIRHLNTGGKDRKYQLSVANALWGQKGYTFLPDFIRLTKDVYEGGLKEVDFVKTEEARKAINHWALEQTKDKIKNLIPEGALASDTRLVLTNAIYFKSAWAEVFPEGATKKEDFHLGGGKKVPVPMMHTNQALRYRDGGTFHALELPYQSRQLSMIVLLPKKGDGLAELEKDLTSARLDEWLKAMKVHQVNVALPKFKFSAEFSLKDVLAAMGMPLAFSKRADFSGMTTREQLYIDKVLHKAFVDVNEKGTEAAAATAVSFRPTSAPNYARANFRADHPFVFLIRENRTGSILFLGRVANPQ
jgi:serpin B